MSATLILLLTWTPYMLQGFLTNIGMAILAMLIGTSMGFLGERAGHGKAWLISAPVRGAITFLRNTPSLVLLFYLSILAPNEIVFAHGGWVLTIPSWLKASFALSASPMVFMYWNFESWRERKNQDRRIWRMEMVNRILESFMITMLASSVSSLVGASELISRCNVIINASSTTNAFAIYSYACLYFCGFLFAIQRIIRMLGNRQSPSNTRQEES